LSTTTIEAHAILSDFINKLLYLKKTAGKSKEKVLVVLDEAQEYIPDRTFPRRPATFQTESERRYCSPVVGQSCQAACYCPSECLHIRQL
jgi:hypothetical protein